MTREYFLAVTLYQINDVDAVLEIEEVLDRRLNDASLGYVTGDETMVDGSTMNVDVAVFELNEGLALVKRTLREMQVAPDTTITQYNPVLKTHTIYD